MIKNLWGEKKTKRKQVFKEKVTETGLKTLKKDEGDSFPGERRLEKTNLG